MRHLKPYSNLLIATLMCVLAACAGLPGPQTFNEKTYAAAVTVEQIQKTATVLLKAGKISTADAENTLKATDAAVEGIKVARSYQASAPATANNKLQTAVDALALLQTYLATQGASK